MTFRRYGPVVAVVFALGVVGCSNNDDDNMSPMETGMNTGMGTGPGELTLPDGHDLADTDTGEMPIMVPAGGMVRRGNVYIGCPADGAACTVNVADGEVTYEGGMPVVTAASDPLTPPAGHGLANTDDTPIMVAAGEQEREGNVDIACPADGAACTVNVADGAVTHLATGGTPVVTAASDSLSLPNGHGLAAATLEAGEQQDGKRGVVIECPAGGNACVVEVAEDGSATYTATGGEPMVAINQMILAANGPEGRHARGLDRTIENNRILTQMAESSGADVAQSTLSTQPVVEASAVRMSDNADPTLSLTLGREAFGILGPDPTIELGMSSDSMIPDLGGDWNGAAFELDIPGGTTVYAVAYSDIGGPDLTEGGTRYVENVPPDLSEPRGREGTTFGADQAVSEMLTGSSGLTLLELDFGIDADGNQITATGLRDWSEELAVWDGNSQLVNQGRPGANSLRVSIGSAGNNSGLSTAYLVCVQVPCRTLTETGMGTDDEGNPIQTTTTTLGGLWALAYQVARQSNNDPEYRVLGAWLSLPDLPNGEYSAGVFAEGQRPYEGNDLSGLTGTATYRGPATGIYTNGTSVPTSGVGAFVAEARLTASFGNDTEFGRVSGAINDFRENGQPLGNWAVTLGLTDITDGVTTGLTAGEADGRVLNGQWGVRFFRENQVGPNRRLPNSAAGTFSASTPIINIRGERELNLIGAFGGSRQ